jgi:hypothetical protein
MRPLVPVTQEGLVQAERERVHEEVRLLADIARACARGDVEEVLHLSNALGWVHTLPVDWLPDTDDQ